VIDRGWRVVGRKVSDMSRVAGESRPQTDDSKDPRTSVRFSKLSDRAPKPPEGKNDEA